MIGIYYLENRLKYTSFFQKLFFKTKIRLDFPLSLNIEVTNNCNFLCSMCPRLRGGRGTGNMDYNLYKKIIDEIVGEKKKLYVLTLIKDGEPLLHPDLGKMIVYAQEKNAAHRIDIFTNGSLLDEKKGRELIESGLDVLTVSLNAALPMTHKKISGTSTYYLVINNLKNFMNLKKKLRAKKPMVVAKAIRMSNFPKKEEEKFRRMWKGVVDQVVIAPLHNYGGGYTKGEKEKRRKKRWPCLPLWFNPVINYDGKVTTCCANYQNNELIMGDINKTSLKKIWQSSKYKELRKDHISGNFSKWPTCEACDYWQNFVDMGSWLEKY